MKVPFNKPSLLGSELTYIQDAVRRGQLAGDGYYTHRCSQVLERYLKVPRVLLTPSCTHALELAALLLDIKPGQEVILPTFTFPSTANAFVLRGGVPRFVDIRPDTLNLDEQKLEEMVTAQTRAICPMHYGGVPCQMDRLMAVANKNHLVVIEDAAQALGAQFQGQLLGTWGALNALSFHETKNVVCGEGGALIITDPRYIQRAEIIRDKGTNRDQFYRGEVDKYSWMDIGSSYAPSELQAAYLLAQLQRLRDVLQVRRRLFERYHAILQPFQDKGRLQLPPMPSDYGSSYHLFYILLDSERERERLLKGLQQRGVLATFHYVPLHLSPQGRRLGYRQGQFPVAESVSRRLLRLPMYNTMSDKEQQYVIRSLERLL